MLPIASQRQSNTAIRTWASIDNKQITIQTLTWNVNNYELTMRTLEPFLPRKKKTRANKQTPYQAHLGEHPSTAQMEL